MNEGSSGSPLSSSDRLRATVWGRLDRLYRDYRFFDLLLNEPDKARQVFELTYEELKSELYIEGIPAPRGRLQELFEEFFQGANRGLYTELIAKDPDLDGLERPVPALTQVGVETAPPRRSPTEILYAHVSRLRALYNKHASYPDRLAGALDPWMQGLVEELEQERVPMKLSEVFETLKRDFLKLHPSLLEPLRKYEDRFSRIRPPEEEVVDLTEEEAIVVTQGGEAGAVPAPTGDGPLRASEAWDLFMSHTQLSSSDYASRIKEILNRWKESFKGDPALLHRFAYLMHRLSQEHLEGLLQRGGALMDEGVMNARQLNAQLGIFYAQTAEAGVRRMKATVRTR